MSDKELFEKFCVYGLQALDARNKCIGLLPEIYKRGIYLSRGYQSIYHLAAKLAGLSKKQVDRVINLERRFEDKPVLHKALLEGEVSFNKLRKVVSIVTVENQQEILESVKALSVRAVETMVRDYKNILVDQNSEMIDGHVTTQTEIFQEELRILPEIRVELMAMQKKGIDINSALKKFLQNYSEEIEIEKAAIAEDLPDQAGRYVPVAITNVLQKEFGTGCSVPGCNRSFYEIHHLIPYALVKKHDPRLMVQLCREHHEITHGINRKNLLYRQGKVGELVR